MGKPVEPRRYKVEGLFIEEGQPEGGAFEGRPPILLLHGACHGAWCWEYWLKELPRRGWHTYTMALRNHPGSKILDRETYCRNTSTLDYVQDLATVTAHIGQPCVVVGHSMGGLIAQKYMETLPNGTEEAGLIMVASGAPAPFGVGKRAPISEETPFLPSKEMARQYFYANAPEEVLEKALARLVGESPSVMNEYSQPPGLIIDPEKVTCPKLVISAELDTTVVPKDETLATFYNADYHFAEGIGHGLMLETGWEKPFDFVCDWLNNLFPAVVN